MNYHNAISVKHRMTYKLPQLKQKENLPSQETYTSCWCVILKMQRPNPITGTSMSSIDSPAHSSIHTYTHNSNPIDLNNQCRAISSSKKEAIFQITRPESKALTVHPVQLCVVREEVSKSFCCC